MAQKQFIIDGGFTTNADSSLTGNLDMTGHIIPSVDSDGTTGYDLGSPSMKWRDLYLSQGSLYIDGQKVIESNSGTIVVQADPGQSLTTKVSGAGVMTLESETTVTVAATLQMASGKRITDQGGNAVVFGDKVDLDNNQLINVGSPTADGHAVTKLYVDQLVGAISTAAITEGDTEIEIADLGTGTVGITVDGIQRLALSSTAAAFTVPVTVNGVELADLNELSTAQSAAETTAAAYTDARETFITTAYTAYSDVQKSRIDAILSASTADTDTFAEVVALVNSVDATNDSVLAGEIANRTSADTALSGRLDTVEGTGTGSVAKAQADAIASAEAKDVVRATAAALDATTKADQALVDAKTYADTAEADAIASAEAKDVVRAATANAYADQAEADAKAYTDTRETAITTAYQSYSDVQKGRVDAILSASSADKDTFAEIVTFINSVDTTNDTALGTEITTRAAADTALSGRLDTVEGSGTGSVAKAEADAIASAEAKDVVRAAAANAYADTAEADAIASAEAKDVVRAAAANAYADQAEADAIASAEAKDVVRASAAAADATAKANAAQSAAEATASADATAKANAALSTAQAYADQAEVDAKGYADTGISNLESSLTHFHSSVVDVTSAVSTSNSTASVSYTFSELSNARHYVVLLNRQVLRPSEYSVSGTTLTIQTGVLATDDELEVTGFSS